jgi:hypothetical protein
MAAGATQVKKDRKFMNKNNNQAWKTKYGPRRVRVEAPTLDEAIFAAQGLTDDPAQQTEIAAALMGLPPDKVRTQMPKPASPARTNAKSVVFAGPADAPRSIVVERKRPSRSLRPAAAHSDPGGSGTLRS